MVDILHQRLHGSQLPPLDISRHFSTTKEFPFQQVPRVSDQPTRLYLHLCPPASYTSRLPALWYKPRALKSTICLCQEIHLVSLDTLERVTTRQGLQLHHHGCLLRRNTRYLNVCLRIDGKHFHIKHTNLEDH